MKNLIDKLQQYANDLDKAKAKRDALSARYELAQENLKKLGCNTVEQAEEKIKELESELEGIHEEIDKMLTAIKEKHTQLFKE